MIAFLLCLLVPVIVLELVLMWLIFKLEERMNK